MPPWAIILVIVWAVLGWACVGLGAWFNRPVELCLFKNFSGIACPSCGFTRGFLSLIGGNFTQAWLYNPLLYSLVIIFGLVFLVRLIFARAVRISLIGPERKVVWLIAAGLLIANWAYVIFCIG
ncbi:MAG: DUF2752 domain-containing protein [Planctomycetota bacterium]